MPKKIKRSTLIKNLDDIFSQYIRLKNADQDGYCTCVTCGKKGFWEKDNIHAGHFISRKHYATRWNEKNVHPQCSYCNTYQYGEQYKYSLFLGSKLSEDLFCQSNIITKFTNNEIKEMINLYKKIVNKLKSTYL
tara:strand:- start:178 stop:579 length:402 start_codon:yes stop_codon:yes gene_type:complete